MERKRDKGTNYMTPERSKKTNPEHRVFYRTTSGWQEGKERKEETTLDFKRQDMKCPEKENLHKKKADQWILGLKVARINCKWAGKNLEVCDDTLKLIMMMVAQLCKFTKY